MTERVKLTGGPEKTVTWIWLESGEFNLEFYDFSETAQKMFGNDIAYILTVNDMTKLYSLAKQDETSQPMDGREFQKLFWNQAMAGRKWNWLWQGSGSLGLVKELTWTSS